MHKVAPLACAVNSTLAGVEHPVMQSRSSANVEDFLRGVEFPCSTDDLIAAAQENGAPYEVTQDLKRLPDQTFQGPEDVAANLPAG